MLKVHLEVKGLKSLCFDCTSFKLDYSLPEHLMLSFYSYGELVDVIHSHEVSSNEIIELYNKCLNAFKDSMNNNFISASF